MRTTASPWRAGASGSPSPLTSEMKCAHSRRNGSSLASFGNVDVALTDLPLGGRPLDGALVVHRELALGLHVVEDGHLFAADDGQLSDLVRIEPGDVRMRHDARREAEVRRRRRPRSPSGGTTRRVPTLRPAPRRSGGGSSRNPVRRSTRGRSRRCETGRGSGDCRRGTARRRAHPRRSAPSTSRPRGGRGADSRASVRGRSPEREQSAPPRRRSTAPEASRRRRACRPEAPASRARNV